MILNLFLHFINASSYLDNINYPQDYFSNENYLILHNIYEKLVLELNEIRKTQRKFNNLECQYVDKKTEDTCKGLVEENIKLKEEILKNQLFLFFQNLNSDFSNNFLSSIEENQYSSIPSSSGTFNDFSLNTNFDKNYSDPLSNCFDMMPSTSKVYLKDTGKFNKLSEQEKFETENVNCFYNDENYLFKDDDFDKDKYLSNSPTSKFINNKLNEIDFISENNSNFFEGVGCSSTGVSSQNYCFETPNYSANESNLFADKNLGSNNKIDTLKNFIKINDIISILKSIPPLIEFKTSKLIKVKNIILAFSRQAKLPQNAYSQYLDYKSNLIKMQQEVEDLMLIYSKQ